MNWDTIGAIGEILGAGAVLITLVYLSLQIRHLKNQTASVTLDQIMASFNEYSGHIASSASLAELIANGRQSYHSLSAADKLRFDNIHYFLLNSLENWFLKRDAVYGMHAEESVNNIEENLRVFCAHPGFKEFWDDARRLYPHLGPVVVRVLEGEN
jgi:hypothetical protein